MTLERLPVAEAAAEVRRLSALVDDALDDLRTLANDVAHAEHAYRAAKARAWAETAGMRDTSTGKPLLAAHREALVQSTTADARLGRDLADGLRQAALEAVRSRRAQLSALQSLLAADRAEVELARTAPQVGA